MASGGYRQPANPAPVSGPGALSKRTDGGPGGKQPIRSLPDPAYGEGQEFRDLQRGAPLPERGAPPGMPPMPLTEPTALPQEPVQAGMPFGPGRNGGSVDADIHTRDMQMVAKYFPAMQAMASRPDVPQGFKRFVTYLKAYT